MRIRTKFDFRSLSLILTSLIGVCFFFTPQSAWTADGETSQSKRAVSVVSFKNGSATGGGSMGSECRGWDWFGGNLGDAFQERLISVLKKSDQVSVLERQVIRNVYENEHELINSEKQRRLARGQFKVADYTLAGTVHSFEWCSSGGGLGVDLGLISLGVKRSHATVGVEIRVIETTTGEVVATFSGKGDSSSTRVDADLLTKNVGLKTEQFNNSPLGEAIDQAIAEAGGSVLGFLEKPLVRAKVSVL